MTGDMSGFFFSRFFPHAARYLFFMMRSVHEETGFVADDRDTGAGMEHVLHVCRSERRNHVEQSEGL